MQTALSTSLIRILRQAHKLESQLLASHQYKLTQFDNALTAFNPQKDQKLYIEYNRRIGPSAFKEPADFVWEPCNGYYDTVRIKIALQK